jgi:mRNA interferase RelE/StbE
MPFSIQFTSRARRGLDGLDRAAQQCLRTHIDRLAANPIPAGAKKLHGNEPYYRIRVGDYRVVYQIEGKRLVVIVVKIGHRKDVYR